MNNDAKELEQYATTKWKDRPNYQCPECPAYQTIRADSFRAHLKSHLKAKAKSAKAKSKPSKKAPAPAKSDTQKGGK